MRALILALCLTLTVTLMATAAFGQADVLEVEDAFSIELPANGTVLLDEEATMDDSLVYRWEPDSDESAISLLQIRVDMFDTAVVDEIYMAFVLGMLETWEEEPENYAVLGAEDGIHIGGHSWTALDIQHMNLEPNVFHTSFSMPYSDRIFTVLFYYLEPGEAVGEQIGQIMASFEPLRLLPATE